MRPNFPAVFLGVFLSLPAAAAEPAVLRVGIQSDIQSLNPRQAIDTISSSVLNNIYENLVRFEDKGFGIVPVLAERWEAGPAFKTWTYYLRSGVKFHDGSPLTAESVVKSFREVAGFPHKVEAASPMKVVFTLASPDADFNQVLAEPYYSITSLKMGADKNLVSGTGPFVFERWDKGKKVVLKRNPGYWQKPAALDGVEFIVYPTQEALIEGLAKGTIDLVAWLVPSSLKALRSVPGLQMESSVGNCTGFLALHTRRAPFDDVRVRRAVAMALNPVGLTSRFFAGTAGAPATSFIPPTLFPYSSKMAINRPDAARALLKEAGWDPAKTYVLLENWAVRPYMPDPHGIALEVQKQLEGVGIRTRVESDPQNFFQRQAKGEFDLILKGWIADSGNAAEFAAANLHSRAVGQYNSSFWKNPKFDALIEACAVLSGKELARKLGEALAVVDEEVPLVPLFFGPQTAAWGARVKNYYVHPSSQIFLYPVELARP